MNLHNIYPISKCGMSSVGLAKFSILIRIMTMILLLSPSIAFAQYGAPNGEWPNFGGDGGNTKYSSLDQINRDNFQDLEVAFRWESISEKVTKTNQKVRPGGFRAIPIMIDGLVYVSTAIGQVAAINAGTGETVWEYDPRTYDTIQRPANTGWLHKGVAYWDDGEDGRIVHATHGLKLISLNAKTGELISDFGEGGIVDTSKGLGKPVTPRVISHAAPVAIVNETIVIGHIVADLVQVKEGAPGHVRGFDARTGKQKWIFHTIPQKANAFGIDTWENDSWKYTGAANVWSFITVDPELGYAYFATGTPTNDPYGGHRLGDGLFGESIICVDAETGKRIWHFQAVHHGLWDYDFPTAPTLMDITVDGKEIKALAQVSKQAFTYVFDRVTGEPIWPIEEREVPPSEVPGDRASPTQPFPTKPAPYDRQGVTEDDLIDFTPELRAEALEIVKDYYLAPMFTPPRIQDEGKMVLNLPGDAGGTNWHGASFDPESKQYFIPSKMNPKGFSLSKPDPSRSNLNYVAAGWSRRTLGPRGLPLLKPPYGRITAIDMNTGDHAWMEPHGNGPNIHPAIEHLNLPPMGDGGNLSPGNLVTKTLLFVNHGKREGHWMKAGYAISVYEKSTGEYLGAITMPFPASGNPITYLHEGKQYIAITGGGYKTAEGITPKPELVAFRLP
jgi:quinoprotein glucose dehydrogenase